MKATLRTIVGALIVSTSLASIALAEPPSGYPSSPTTTRKEMRSEERRGEVERQSEVAPKERAAFRWESSADRIRKTQEALNKHGAALKIDGVLGETTRDQLRRYQRDNKLTETGRIDDATAKSLGIETK